jgi:hypothetical protein
MRRLAAAAILTAALAACGSDDDDSTGGTVAGVTTDPDEPTTPTESTPPPTESTPSTTESTVPPFSALPLEPDTTTSVSISGTPIEPTMPLVVAAVEDLASRVGVSAADVDVVTALAVTWGDSSLGCPEPGMMYLQQLVDGTLVVLEAGGRRYEYHGGNPLFLCENPTPPSGGG